MGSTGRLRIFVYLRGQVSSNEQSDTQDNKQVTTKRGMQTLQTSIRSGWNAPDLQTRLIPSVSSFPSTHSPQFVRATDHKFLNAVENSLNNPQNGRHRTGSDSGTRKWSRRTHTQRNSRSPECARGSERCESRTPVLREIATGAEGHTAKKAFNGQKHGESCHDLFAAFDSILCASMKRPC